jgi:hypothetical protein
MCNWVRFGCWWHFNLEIIKGVSIFITEKMMVEMLNLLEISITNLLAKLTKKKEREKEVTLY